MRKVNNVNALGFDNANGKGSETEVSCTVTTIGNGAVALIKANRNVSVKREGRNYILKPSDTCKS